MANDRVWPRTRWIEAIWSSDLEPLQKLVAAVYFDHAGRSSEVWVTLNRLQERSGLSRSIALKHLKALVNAGFLTVVQAAGQHRSTRYGLTYPSGSGSEPLSSSGDEPLTDASGSLQSPSGSLQTLQRFGSHTQPELISHPMTSEMDGDRDEPQMPATLRAGGWRKTAGT